MNEQELEKLRENTAAIISNADYTLSRKTCLEVADQLIPLISQYAREQQQAEDTKYYAEMMKEALDKIRKKAREQGLDRPDREKLEIVFCEALRTADGRQRCHPIQIQACKENSMFGKCSWCEQNAESVLALIPNEKEIREQVDKLREELTDLNKKLDDREVDLIEAKREEREKIFSFIRQVGQDIDEDGKGTGDPSKVVETIWYIGEGRLKDFEQALQQARQCARCGATRTDGIDSDICGNCADDLRMEQQALEDSPE